MARRRKKLVGPVEITDMAVEGKGLGRFEDLVLFVKDTVPGDVVEVLLHKKRTNWAEGEAVRFLSKSADRIPAFCEHFGICGGCKWQHLAYEQQLAYKHRQAVEAIRRIGKVEEPPAEPILPAPATRFYRNKLEFSFTQNRWLSEVEIASGEEFDRRGAGFNLAGHFDRVLDLQQCHLQPSPSNEIRLFVRDYGLKHDWDFFDNRRRLGFLRSLMIRTTSLGEVMVLVQFFEESDQIGGLMDALIQQFPQISSLYYVVNRKGNDTIFDLPLKLVAGNPWIVEQMEGLQFRIGPKSFFQTNSEQAHNLYSLVREYAQLSGKEVVYDLYTGTGTIALFLAKHARQVIGLEYVPEAIEDARENALLNQLTNTHFFAGDIKDLLNEEFSSVHPAPDVVVTDPPRAGMHADVVHALLGLKAKRIVYVSCNPATQARDLALLAEGYRLVKMRPVDMFPHTWHIENVALLERLPRSE